MNFPLFKLEKDWKDGSTVSISLELMPSAETKIPWLALDETRKKGWNGVVQDYKIQNAGKKGFLGMGARPNTYQVQVKLFPMQILPEVLDPKISIDAAQINEYVNRFVQNLIWDKDKKFLQNNS